MFNNKNTVNHVIKIGMILPLKKIDLSQKVIDIILTFTVLISVLITINLNYIFYLFNNLIYQPLFY